MAPVYDNGSCMYPRLNTDKQLKIIMGSKEEIDNRIFRFPTSQVKIDGRKSSYYEVIHSLKYRECNEALLRIVKRMNLDKIFTMIDSVEGITEVRKYFYKTMYKQRYEKILLAAYNKIVS